MDFKYNFLFFLWRWEANHNSFRNLAPFSILSDLFWSKTVESIDSIVLDSTKANYTWPLKKTANMDGEITLGGLHMVHERNAALICGPIMAQGGIDNFQYLNFSFCIQTKLQLWKCPGFKSSMCYDHNKSSSQ